LYFVWQLDKLSEFASPLVVNQLRKALDEVDQQTNPKKDDSVSIHTSFLYVLIGLLFVGGSSFPAAKRPIQPMTAMKSTTR
jgi:hypothetical protein